MCDSETSQHACPRADLPRATAWLLDGFNVLHAVLLGGQPRNEWWTAPQRERLLERVSRFCDHRAPICVVFDGPYVPDGAGDDGAEDRVASTDARDGGEANSRRTRVVFAPSADDWLVHRIRGSERPSEIAIVTSDRKLAGRCRHLGAAVVRPHDFLAHCPAAPQPD